MRIWPVTTFIALAFVACAGAEKDANDTTQPAAATASSGVALTGAGATFPYPIYNKWFSDYAAQTGVKINYQSIGSGGGIQQLSAGTVDFGASDSPMTDAEIQRARGGHVLHFPTVLGADVITYNLSDLSTPLRLTGELIADIFLGKVTKWNDARLAVENPGVELPNRDIIVVHRSDGSGTTFIFTDYLSTVSTSWASGPGRGKEVKWPVGLGGKGNEGVTGQVKATPGSIGYVELAYARQNGLPAAHVKNAAGNYVDPKAETITAAAEGAVAASGPNPDYRISIVNAPGANAYPISSFTWLLVYETQPSAEKGRKLVDFMKWMYSQGQQSAVALDYAPLPGNLAAQLTERLNSIKLSGTP